ncbi:MAG TPA: response regulator [Blastocatellia bacterium]|nr:response regulator [Blastocatellia bacterium]
MTNTPTVLLAEDDATSRKVYRAALEGEGYKVIDVADGVTALSVLEEENVDLLLTDFLMPGLNGIELIGRARNIRPNLRAVIMSGHKTSETVMEAFRKKACDFLTKPFHLNELVDAVEAALKRDALCQIEIISDKPDWIELRVPCDLDAVEPIQRFLSDMHPHLPKETSDAIGSVFRELLNNAIEHGGKCDHKQRVEVKYIRLKRAIIYSIKDPGEGFDLRQMEHAAFTNPADNPFRHMQVRQQKGMRPGGFGIMLASQVIDELIYNDRHNELIFVKYLDESPTTPPAES